MDILNLSDEVLVIIFDFLEGTDKVILSQTCCRFNEILKEKKLSRKMDLCSSYSVSLSDLKLYLKPKIIQQNITEFNITSCYWLNSSDISSMVGKMVNLEALYSADTSLTFDSLLKLLRSLPKLKRLSFTWKKCCKMDAICSISDCLRTLEYMSLYIKNDEIQQCDCKLILYLISHCEALQELRIIAPWQATGYVMLSGIQQPIISKMLHTLVMSVPGYSCSTGYVGALYHVIMEATQNSNNWQCFWVTSPNVLGELTRYPDSISDVKTLVMTNASTLLRNELPNMEHLVMDQMDLSVDLFRYEIPKLKKLFWNTAQPTLEECHGDLMWISPEWQIDWNALWNYCGNLEELNIGTCLKDVTEIHFQEKLKKLALATCVLRGNSCEPSSKAEKTNRILRIIVESCLNITEFEFTPCSTCSFTPTGIEHEPSFGILAKWKNLRRLKLEHLECFRTGKPLSHILRTCENLVSISLKDIGQHGVCSYLFELCKGLEHCKNLKDFRLEQANIVSVDSLLVTLKICSKLERICIISTGHSKCPQNKTVTDMARKLEKLIFLYMEITGWPQSCKQLAQLLNIEFKLSRPAFIAAFFGGTSSSTKTSDVKTLPGVHYFEMREDVSRISTWPSDGNKFLFRS